MSDCQFQEIGDVGSGIQSAEFGLGVEDGQGGAVVGGVHRTGVKRLSLGEMTGDDFLAALVLAFDEQFIGSLDVVAKLAVVHAPLFFGSILHDVVELCAIEPNA